MKKILCVIAVAGLAFAANAAKVSWGMSQIQYTENESVAANYTAFLVDASAYDSLADAAEAIYGGATVGIINQQAGVNVATATPTIKVQGNQIAMPSSYDSVPSMSFYEIIFDGSVGEEATAKNWLGAEKANVVQSAAGLFAAAAGSQASNTWAAVPEPTSGLLLLLGMAGLALRRKHV